MLAFEQAKAEGYTHNIVQDVYEDFRGIGGTFQNLGRRGQRVIQRAKGSMEQAPQLRSPDEEAEAVVVEVDEVTGPDEADTQTPPENGSASQQTQSSSSAQQQAA